MNRAQSIISLQTQPHWDILVIGGGATGLSCALDAASRGYKTLLVEKNDFAKGTSSRSTKLVHGGVRYLAQGNIRLVREALHERGRLIRNAPHVCTRKAFVVPCYKWWHAWYYGAGLWLYEFLSGKWSLGPTRLLSVKNTLKHLPSLSAQQLRGGILYFDGCFDDTRLAINLAQTAAEQGATVLNYAGVTSFVKEKGSITGACVYDSIGGHTYTVKAKAVINATGVFADELLKLAENKAMETIVPSQGIHLVADKRFFSGDAALMIPETDDKRVLFAVPWHDKVLLGTTDTFMDHIAEEPTALPSEVDFVISHINRYLSVPLSRGDISSVFAGLRPLAKNKGAGKTSVMPRDHQVEVLASGLIHVTGGKWTTCRSMAEHALDRAAKHAGLPPAPCRTRNLRIHGWCATMHEADHLAIYGADAAGIRQLMEQDEKWSTPIHKNYPYTAAEVLWMVRHEMAITTEDILSRRLRLLFLDAAAAVEAAPVVTRILADELQQNSNWMEEQLARFNEVAKGYMLL